MCLQQQKWQDGIDLGTMDAKLLQKLEELTLYVIQQQKQIDELQEKIGRKNKINFMKHKAIKMTVFILIACIAACKKPGPTSVYLNTGFKNYFNYQVGSY